MRKSRSTLSAPTIAILEMIAAGRSFDQLLEAHPRFSHWDIRLAAEEALTLSGAKPRRARRERYARSDQKWTEGDDALLRHLLRSGTTVARIAGQLQRNRDAIRGRIMKLGLASQLTPDEAERLRRVIGPD